MGPFEVWCFTNGEMVEHIDGCVIPGLSENDPHFKLNQDILKDLGWDEA
jgi:hypothetical protein